MKLPNGYGSVIKLSGKRRKPYAARITTSWSPDGKQIKKYLGCFKTRQDAYKALADFNDNPFDLETKKITFAQLFERWQKIRYKDKVIQGVYIAAYKKLAPLYNMPFADIRKRHIQGVIDLEIVSTNYASLVELPPKNQSKIHQPFTPYELKILWQNANDFTAKLALILCGCRYATN